jgi:2-oxoglutarate dehydrogenase E2 component (dihydrolipoamide succinyltransferase)
MDIVMPKMGESINEGTILKWHKKKGDFVKRDEIIFEISTDKVDTEIPSPVEGILSDIKFKEGDSVEVGTVVAVIDSKEDVSVKVEPPSETANVLSQRLTDEKIIQTNISEDKNVSKNADLSQHPLRDESIEITMPKMGESVMEGTIIKWHKKVGDSVRKDETIFEISTDKVDTEVPSPADGFVTAILVGEQETVEVGTVVAKLSLSKTFPNPSANENNAGFLQTLKEEKSAEHISEPVETSPNVSLSQNSVNENMKVSKFLSPLVMNIMREENLSFDEIEKISGSGIDGRITKKDILNYLEDKKSKKILSKELPDKNILSPEGASPASINFEINYSENEVENIPMDNIRQKIMQHMINSRDTSVHVSALIEVDMSKIYNFIKANRDEYLRKENLKLTYMPFIAHATVKALKEFPLINSSIEGFTIVRKKFINLGIAVAIEPSGLIVPNIKNADEKSILGIAKSINDIADRARSKKLTPDDITNGTFTITNYGVFGTIFGTPIINQPEVAILGVGAVVKKPVVVEFDGVDSIAIKPIMALTISHDHRLVDGMLGGKFLKYIKDMLESFDGKSI